MNQNKLTHLVFHLVLVLIPFKNSFCQKITDYERVYSNRLFLEDSDSKYNNDDTLIFVTVQNLTYEYFPNIHVGDTLWSSDSSDYYFDYYYYSWLFQSKERGASIQRNRTINGKFDGVQISYDIKFQYFEILGLYCFVIRYKDDLFIYRLVKYEDLKYDDKKVFYYVKVGNDKIETFEGISW